MGGSCPEGLYWDILVKECLHCRYECKRSHVIAKCTSYCEFAHCKAQPGHYYDGLLKRCLRCADVCGGHPAECSHYCQTLPPPVTTKMPLAEVKHSPYSRGHAVTTALEDSNVLLYSLLALCMLLVVSSLSLAMAVFPRRSRTTPNPGSKEANHKQKCIVKLGEEVGLPRGQQSPKGFLTNPSRPTDREPSEDSSPTETCVCVHCFPDLKALGQGNDRPPRAPFTFYHQAVLHKPQTQKGGSLCPEESLHTEREEAAVG
ncbi:Tumor necrosis factor receptor superfamily member 13B Transmembrane activator and CAML interactor [Channa argus]|uniref:Tumor necrosis factor receptor superfamily member 13B Transmembrane activator and CAML interactor n=1 Tax=Channa argus TaxID=215402 RepID=A0A6G1QQX3_CHAAH|nr:Tumor necrosis factor receptor superfamily member 13B Transmembrane activator and CAML interactor [Channa argus]KAK2885115.1 hypothetical protein Q8A73_021589 [Channa argus]